MMSAGIRQEFQVAIYAFVCGSVITVVYDLIRILRRIWSHDHFWIGVEDLFFWIWTSLWIFSVLYRENDGSFRMYTILSMVLGMLLYHKVLSDPFVKITSRILKKLVNLLIYPLKMLKNYTFFWGNKLKNQIQRIIIKDKNQNRE